MATATEQELDRSWEMEASEAVPEQIAALAYTLWLERGCPEGSPEEDWFRAERELKA